MLHWAMYYITEKSEQAFIRKYYIYCNLKKSWNSKFGKMRDQPSTFTFRGVRKGRV